MAQKKAIKIEFALADQINDNTKKAIQLVKELQSIENEIDQIAKSIDKAKTKYKEGESFYDESVKLAYKLGGELENLGIEPRSSKLYNSHWDIINSVQNKANRIATKIKQLN